MHIDHGMWNSGGMKRELGFDDEGRPVLITAAATPYEEQHRQRVRKYLTIMSFRIPALIFLAAAAYGLWHNGLISLAIIAVSLPLPWMAVLIANDRPPPRRAEEPPRRFNDTPAPDPAVPACRTSRARGRDPGSATAFGRWGGRPRFPLTPGSVLSQDILRLLGIPALQRV